jgi:hypothetical protein
MHGLCGSSTIDDRWAHIEQQVDKQWACILSQKHLQISQHCPISALLSTLL